MTDNTRQWNPLGQNAVVGTLLVTGEIIPAQPAGSVTTDPATVAGDGGATPLGVVGAGAQTGQLQTNANGVKVKTRSGALGFAEVLTFAGDPNGVITADKGSLVMDITNAKLWVNTTGAAVWVQVGAGAAAKLFDVALPTTTFVNGGNENDVNFGALGLTTYAPFVSTVNEHITGISNNGAAMTAADDGRVICISNFGPNALFVNPGSVLSVASNRLTTTGGGVTSIAVGGTNWFRYDGNPAVLLWRTLAASNQAA